jgi:SARP family transcriptional regulator, regulator of embCAB operon
MARRSALEGGNGMEFRVLGPVEVRHDGHEVPLDGSKQRTVLAALLMAGDRLVSDTEMTGYLWGDYPPITMNAQIYTYISRLRKILGNQVCISRRSPGYLLWIGAARFDLAEFQAQAQLGHVALADGRYDEAAELLRSALALWQGPALVNVSEQLSHAEGPQLEEARITALAGRVDADLALGRHVQVLPELTGLVQRFRLQERFRAQLMTALYRGDRRADALVVYDQGRRMLAEELGIDPGSLLQEVHHAILTGAVELWATGPPLAAAGVGGASRTERTRPW